MLSRRPAPASPSWSPFGRCWPPAWPTCNPSTPPAPHRFRRSDAAVTNSRLGWVHAADGTSRPGGPTIGYLVNPSGARGIPPHVLLDPKNSFAQAHRQYPDLIPYGSTERAAWTSVWTEELVTEQHWQRRLAGNGSKRVVVRVMVNGTFVEGVPVPLDVLFGNHG